MDGDEVTSDICAVDIFLIGIFIIGRIESYDHSNDLEPSNPILIVNTLPSRILNQEDNLSSIRTQLLCLRIL